MILAEPLAYCAFCAVSAAFIAAFAACPCGVVAAAFFNALTPAFLSTAGAGVVHDEQDEHASFLAVAQDDRLSAIKAAERMNRCFFMV